MPSCHREHDPRRMLQAFLSLTVLVGLTTSTHLLGQDVQCGELLPNTNIPGRNLRGSRAPTPDDEACIALCEETAGCNAVVRIPSSECFLKTVDADTTEPTFMDGSTSFILCHETDSAIPDSAMAYAIMPYAGMPVSDMLDPGMPISAPAPVEPGVDIGELQCDELLVHKDIDPGINLPGSGVETLTYQACIALCEETESCNAIAMLAANGRCFLKAVDLATVVVVDTRGLSAFIFCDTMATAPIPITLPPTPPPDRNSRLPLPEFQPDPEQAGAQDDAFDELEAQSEGFQVGDPIPPVNDIDISVDSPNLGIAEIANDPDFMAEEQLVSEDRSCCTDGSFCCGLELGCLPVALAPDVMCPVTGPDSPVPCCSRKL